MSKETPDFNKVADKLLGGLISATLVVLMADRALDKTGYRSTFAANHEYLNGALDVAIYVLNSPMMWAATGTAALAMVGGAIGNFVRQAQDNHRSNTHFKILKATATISSMLEESGIDIADHDIGKASYKEFKALNKEIKEVEAQLIAKGVDQPSQYGVILGNLKSRHQGPISILDAAKGMLEGMKDIALNGAPEGTINETFRKIKDDVPLARKPVDNGPSLG
jgi:hypothetical protein